MHSTPATPLFQSAIRWLTFPAALAVFAAATAAIYEGWLPRPHQPRQLNG